MTPSPVVSGRSEPGTGDEGGLPFLHLVGVEDKLPVFSRPASISPPRRASLTSSGQHAFRSLWTHPLQIQTSPPLAGLLSSSSSSGLGSKGGLTEVAARMSALRLFFSLCMALVQTSAVKSSSMSEARSTGGFASSLGLEMVWVGR